MQLKMHDEIIQKMVELDKRLLLLEETKEIQISDEQEKKQTSLDNFYGED
tara:strand:+ start:4164 stop:4313 length:150 start_codon:yes stop_codon:yes gene_type:complete